MVSKLWFQLLLVLLLGTAAMASSNTTDGYCTRRCGRIDVPYPFGTEPGCYMEGFDLACNRSKLLLDNTEFIDIDLLNGQARVYEDIAWQCYDSLGHPYNSMPSAVINLTDTPYTFSSTRNTFTAIGCYTTALFNGTKGSSYSMAGCVSICNENTTFGMGLCSGAGCCQTAIPSSLNIFNTTLFSFLDNAINSWNNFCSYAFLADKDWYRFNTSDLYGNNFLHRSNHGRVPMVLDWSIGGVGCEEAKLDVTSYACRSEKSVCLDSPNGRGYLCNCSDGYQGNPYLENGCQDINECNNPKQYGCYESCVNKPGTFNCTCSEGKSGNPRVQGGCVFPPDIFFPLHKAKSRTIIIIGVSIGGGTFLLLVIIAALWTILKELIVKKRKEKCFQRNLDLLRKEQSSTDGSPIERMKIYDLDELEKATNNFDKTRIVGGGGHGHVYKGILSDQRVVAIKRPKITDQNELGQFINEMFLLSQTSHRNFVTFFGCCLQTEVPLLVFEFISGGTLCDHLVDNQTYPTLSFEDRLRIATEVARALSYLHSEASITIFHRDVKSSNILLDERNTAKLADFGASRSVPLERTSITTVVQGTYGYLDPEYHQTGRLTEKSDVYSFGVILVELLIGRIARYLLMDFMEALEQNSLFEILDPRVLEEGTEEEVESFASLADMCLKLNGYERPKMKEVEDKLEAMRSKRLKGDDARISGNKRVTNLEGTTLFETSPGSTMAQCDSEKLVDVLKPNDDARGSGNSLSQNSGVMNNLGGTSSSKAGGKSSTRQYSMEMELSSC